MDDTCDKRKVIVKITQGDGIEEPLFFRGKNRGHPMVFGCHHEALAAIEGFYLRMAAGALMGFVGQEELDVVKSAKLVYLDETPIPSDEVPTLAEAEATLAAFRRGP